MAANLNNTKNNEEMIDLSFSYTNKINLASLALSTPQRRPQNKVLYSQKSELPGNKVN